MSVTHPYISGASAVAQMVTHLRKGFPPTVNSDIVKKLGLAPKSESFVINAIQFVGIVDEDGKKTDNAATAFSHHRDEDFQKAFEQMVESAYQELFNLHGKDSWDLSKDDLITFFRQSDQTGAVVGGRQAKLFSTFAALAGHGEIRITSKSANAKTAAKPAKKGTPKKMKEKIVNEKPLDRSSREFGLNVKVEINLPSDASAETYDNIFKSIRKNLLNG